MWMAGAVFMRKWREYLVVAEVLGKMNFTVRCAVFDFVITVTEYRCTVSTGMNGI